MAEIDVSVINYRTGALTLACVESVLADLAGGAARPPIDGRIIVVDNASGDGSAEEIAGWIATHPDAPVELIRSPINSGFSGGHNQGIAAGRSDFVLLLNSDAELKAGCLQTLLAAAATHPEAGLLVPRLEGADGSVQTSCFRFHSAASELIRGAASGPVTKLLHAWDVPLGPAPDPASIDWASFACILLRRQMIAEIGPMDEGYFLYFEDAEYAWRARKAGWAIHYVPEASAVHHRGGSGPVKALAARRKRLPAYYYASRTRYFYQTGGWPGLLGANAAWLAGRGVAQLRRLFGKAVPKAVESEAKDIWINATRPLALWRPSGE